MDFSPGHHDAFVRGDDPLRAIGVPMVSWSMLPLPPLHGDIDPGVIA